ncbi:MAG TPA: antibiotic biosynthesis monooxygenase [Desulfobacteraceae bacterium]|nr:antibiotic biosynthesis monooxygenase [Deltaproteobacteria bacterium]MBW2355709.1 antibiotic biosynthesis monooxygenase [Deltaproteobacteria bacterium]RLB99278.1 MAG: antibiotic biosynthesis monooxygenase [Deltaproteobacteria bacterium]HDI59255.1 antibiotic biosynthesis monooxygenase [Desulfobacteraceae bacterium]
MTVKILIKRKYADSQAAQLEQMLIELRRQTVKQPGYVSGETLQRLDRPGETLVISTWESADHWRQWTLNPERGRVQERIDALLGTPTVYEIYAHRK